MFHRFPWEFFDFSKFQYLFTNGSYKRLVQSSSGNAKHPLRAKYGPSMGC
jgi:hypothetical protein